MGMHDLLARIRALFTRNRMEKELDDELQFHLEMEISRNVERGMDPLEARRRAMAAFGGVEGTKEACRDERGTRFLEDMAQDVQFGLRMLRKNAGFTAVAVLTLGLGIGANTAIFSLVNGVLLQPLPYGAGERTVRVRHAARGANIGNFNFSVPDLEDYRARTSTFDGMVEFHSMSFILLGHGEPERVETGVVSTGFFQLLGVRPLHGRSFVNADDEAGAEAVLILAYPYWMARFSGDPDVVGTTVKMNDRMHTIVGVLPDVPPYPEAVDVYMPPAACPFRSDPDFIANRQARMMRVLGVLKPGVSALAAQADLSRVARELQHEYSQDYPQDAGYALTATPLRTELTQNARTTFLVLLGTVGLVLLIACANVANLTLARLIRREPELAVRAALGAGRGRIMRQLLTESVLVSLAGGALGLLIASGGLDLLVRFASRFTPRAGEIRIDGMVLGYTVLLSIATGLLFGLIPALPARFGAGHALKESGERFSASGRKVQLRDVLIVSQLAISSMLLIAAGLMVRSFVNLQQVDPGFQPSNVLTAHLNLNWSKYNSSETILGFHQQFLPAVQSLPGVAYAGLASNFPLNGRIPRDRIHIEGRATDEREMPLIDFRAATPDYFRTLGIPLLRGRTFTDADRDGAPRVAIINRSMARHYWGNDDPVGARISFDLEEWLTVVGVVGDVRQHGLDQDAVDEFYLSFWQSPTRTSQLLVRTAGAAMSLARSVSAEVYNVDAEQPISGIRTLEQIRSNAVASPRLTTMLMSLFALLSLVITATGIGAVTAFSVSQRTHEIGIRMALGAGKLQMLFMVLGQGMALVVAGLGLGLAGALGLTRLLSGLLFQVGPTDPLTFVGVALSLGAVATLSCLVPARRAVTVEPMSALRTN